MRLDGVYVAHTTPFTANGEVDTAALKKHLEWLADAGVDGFVPAGTTGEGSVLTADEWKVVVTTAVEIGRKRKLKVIAGCGGNHTEKVRSLLLDAQNLGCDAALVVTPYYNRPTPRGLLAHYRYLAEHTQIPIVLYNVPGRTAVNLPVETALELFEHPRIVGIKEASGQYAQWLALSSKMDLKTKAFLAGDDDAFAATLALGGCGIISASANVAPKLFVQLHRHAVAGEWNEATAVQKKLMPLVRALFLETSPSPVKWALNRMGFGRADVRLPLVEITDGTAKQLGQAMQDLEIRS